MLGKIKNVLRKIKYGIVGTPIEKLRRKGVTIGENVHIFDTSIDSLFPFLVSIGDNVTLTDVKILAHDASTYKQLGYTKVGKVTIGNDVFVGARSLILPNVTIGDKVIIGAGSIVTKSIPGNSVAVGNPCRVICTYDEYMEKHESLMQKAIIFDKKPAELTETEIRDMQNKNDGIWYMR